MKLWQMIPPALFFILKITLAVWGVLWLYIDFRIIFSSSVKNGMSILEVIMLNL